MLLTCNDKPEIDANDGGTWRRLRVVPFEMKFVDNPREPNERKINRKIKEELPYWKDALMSILIKRFKNYKINGLLEPSKVTEFTAEYQKDSDIYFEFIDYFLFKTDNNNDVIDIVGLHNLFKNWFKEGNPEKRSINKKEFRKQLAEKIKSIKGYVLTGYKIMEHNTVNYSMVSNEQDNDLDNELDDDIINEETKKT